MEKEAAIWQCRRRHRLSRLTAPLRGDIFLPTTKDGVPKYWMGHLQQSTFRAINNAGKIKKKPNAFYTILGVHTLDSAGVSDQTFFD